MTGQRHFDQIADCYDESIPSHVAEHYLGKRVSYVGVHASPGDALDVGCGTGVLADRLARQGWSVTGIDPSEGMLERLRARTQRVEAVLGDATALPFADSAFDLVLSVAVMHHIADPAGVRTALAEMVRVCRPDGLVLVWDHNPRNPYWPLLMRRVPQDTGEERLIPELELTAALRDAGADIVEAKQLGFVPDFVPRRLLAVATRVERRLEASARLRRFAAHNVVLARRRRPQGRT